MKLQVFSPAAEEAALDDLDHEGSSFLLTHVRVEPSSDEGEELSLVTRTEEGSSYFMVNM